MTPIDFIPPVLMNIGILSWFFLGSLLLWLVIIFCYDISRYKWIILLVCWIEIIGCFIQCWINNSLLSDYLKSYEQHVTKVKWKNHMKAVFLLHCISHTLQEVHFCHSQIVVPLKIVVTLILQETGTCPKSCKLWF